jgi:hypothetical protein
VTARAHASENDDIRARRTAARGGGEPWPIRLRTWFVVQIYAALGEVP